MLRSAVVAVAAAGLVAVVTAASPPAPKLAPTAQRAELIGRLGVEGGPYPGGFHPTPGSVEVYSLSVALDQRVGPSGHFNISLPPGKYSVIGCGPSASGASTGQQCSTPETITLTSGQVRHIELIWANVP